MIIIVINRLEKKKVCVFVRAYNASKFIDACLGSLINQDFSSEIYIKILYDEGTKDDTLIVLTNYLTDHNNQAKRHIEIIQHEHCSPFKSLLIHGLMKFRDEYDFFSILDYDNLYHTHYITKSVESLELLKADFLYSIPVVIDKFGHLSGKNLVNIPLNVKRQLLLKYMILGMNFIDINAIFMTKDAVKIIIPKLIQLSSPGYDWIFEDWVIGALAVYYLNVNKLEDHYIYYRVHEGNITGGLRNPEKDKINFNRGILTLSCFRILLGQDFTITQRLFYMFSFIFKLTFRMN